MKRELLGTGKQAAQKSDFREKENKEAKPCDVPAHFPGSLSFRMARMYAESVGREVRGLSSRRSRYLIHETESQGRDTFRKRSGLPRGSP